MSGPPVKQLPDGGVRRSGNEAERRFAYYTPKKRRATLYEDVTVDTQPSTRRHLERGWLVSFEDGRGTWNEESTLLRSTDWYDFRDPGELWERNYYQRGSRTEAQIEAGVRNAAEEGLMEDFDPTWVEFLRNNLQTQAFVEQGLWLATASVGRDCLSDSITRAVVFGAAVKQRAAQSIVIYGMDLEPHFGDFDIDAAKERWLNRPVWQPTRALVERLHTSCDWGEVIVAANLCVEPFVGAAVRRELGIRAAGQHGDMATPIVAGAAQEEAAWLTGWSAALTQFVLADGEHGEHNREVLAGWLADWLPAAQAAADALLDAAAEALPGFSAADARERVRREADRLYARAGLTELVDAAGVAA